jgi:putative flippase GtrA
MLMQRFFRSHFFTTFYQSQFAALVATGLDFATLIILVELFHVWYILATAIGALAGGITNFTISRHWVFKCKDEATLSQGTKYILVSASSLLLNVAGVYILTEWFELQYICSKVLTSIAVAFFFNYPLHRFFVFIK